VVGFPAPWVPACRIGGGAPIFFPRHAFFGLDPGFFFVLVFFFFVFVGYLLTWFH